MARSGWLPQIPDMPNLGQSRYHCRFGIQLDSLRKQSLSRSNALQELPAKLCRSLPDRAFAANDMMKLVFLVSEVAQQRRWLNLQPLQNLRLLICNPAPFG